MAPPATPHRQQHLRHLVPFVVAEKPSQPPCRGHPPAIRPSTAWHSFSARAQPYFRLPGPRAQHEARRDTTLWAVTFTMAATLTPRPGGGVTPRPAPVAAATGP